MEAHPVPQNVTSFEFHLVGDMTLKQFGYLASGLIIAYLTYIFGFSASPVIAIPVIIISSSMGAAFAFLPIQDRPLDHWVLAFFRAVYSPTKRAWQNPFQKKIEASDPFFKNRLKLYLNAINPAPEPQSSAISRQPSDVLKANSEASLTSQVSNSKIKGLSRLLPNMSQDSRPAAPQGTAVPAGRQVVDTRAEVVPAETPVVIQPRFYSEAVLNPLPDPPLPPPPPKPTPPPRLPVYQASPPPASTPASFGSAPIATSVNHNPNIISGTIIDTASQPVEGAIIIITNEANLPVRALKTGKNGTFTGATSLPSGKYLITVEKEGHNFGPVSLELTGVVIPGVIIQSKGASS